MKGYIAIMKKILTTLLFLLGFFGAVQAQNCSASFNYSASPTNLFQYNFNNTSLVTINFDSIFYSWSFGDGNVSSQTNPSHLYNSPGTYIVCLQMDVMNSQGSTLCFDTICTTINISFSTTCNPNFQWSASAANPNLILFQDQSIVQNVANGDSVRRTWNFGDGTSTSAAPIGSFTHIYQNPGMYPVCLTIAVIDSGGVIICTNTFCDSVIINSIPISCVSDFRFFPDSANKHSLTFIDSSSYSSNAIGAVDSIIWDFGDGTFGFGDSVNHNYSLSGTYSVCQYIYIIQQGTIVCSDSICKQVRVKGDIDFCQIEFIIDSVNSYAGVVYVWNLGDSLNQSTNNSYFWDFGDGMSSNQAYPSHQYATTGSYYLCLTIISINSFGDTCVATYCDSLIVNPNGSLGKFNSGFTLNVLNPLSIGMDEFKAMKMDIYPNPANDVISILPSSKENQNLKWNIYSLSGKLMLKGQMEQRSGSVEKINVSSLRNGIYLISIEGKSSVFNSKLKISRW